ncbi:MAG TPA: hypothetical protein PLJ62_05670 [Thermoflexales bacterium]|nr:hypothetical protein [Thermoflexales bacterium]
MPTPSPLETGCYYHIFNRGNNGEDVFREERNYEYFLKLYAHHILPVAETYAFCLLKNHFHLAIRVREDTKDEQTKDKLPPASRAFSNFFNAYARAINKEYARTGSLFENPFHRIKIQTDSYFSAVVLYIHRNPQKHRFLDDFRDWKWSSYHAHLSDRPTKLERERVLGWFNGRDQFVADHLNAKRDGILEEQDFL